MSRRLPPGSVWLTGTSSNDVTERSRDDVPPAVAVRALRLLTEPGDVVYDPDCGTGTTLAAALRLGRHAVGSTDSDQSWRAARATVTTAKLSGAITDGTVLRASAGNLGLVGLLDRVQLALVAVRDLDRLPHVLNRCAPLLKPTGHVVVVARPRRRQGELLDVLPTVLACGRTAGLVPLRRYIATTDGGRSHLTLTGPSTRRHPPIATPRHHYVLIFSAPGSGLNAATLPRTRELAV